MDECDVEEENQSRNSKSDCHDVEEKSTESISTEKFSSDPDSQITKNSESEKSSERSTSVSSHTTCDDDLPNDDEESFDGESSSNDEQNPSRVSQFSDDLAPNQQLRSSQKKARSLTKDGQHQMAISEYIRCLALARIVYGDNHWCLAQAHMILAKNYLDLLNYPKQALDHGNQAKDIIILWKEAPKSEKKKWKFFYVLINIYTILGRAETILSRFSLAQKYLQTALKISVTYSKNFSEDAREQAVKCNVLISLAKLYFMKEEFKESIEMYEEAIEQMTKIYGQTNLALISVRQNLGRSLQKCGRAVEATKQFQEAFEIAANLFGDKSERAIKAEVVLSKNYLNNSNHDKAEQHLQNILSKVTSPDFTNSAIECEAVDLLIPILTSSKRYEEATNLIESILSKKCRLFGQTSKQVINTLSLLGSLYLTLNEPTKSAKYLKKCYDRQVILFGSNHPRVENTKVALRTVCQSSVVPKKFQILSSKPENRPRFLVSGIKD